MKKILSLLLGVIILTTVSFASSDIGFKSIGPRLGFVDPETAYDGTLDFGLAVDLGTWVKQLHWDASLEYWSSSYGWNYPPYGTSDVTLNDFALRTGVLYHFVEGELEPYAGGGLGIHFYSWDFPSRYPPADNSDSDIALYIQGGLEYKFNAKWSGDANLRLDFGDLDQTHVFVTAKYMLGK